MTARQRNAVDATGQPPPERASVAELLPRIHDGDPAAWEEIVRRYGKLVSTTVRAFRLQPADALDAVQMTWLRLAENALRVKFPERLGGWLVTTARRECLHILRQAKPVSSLIDDVTPETVPDPSVDSEQHVIETDTAQTLRKLIAELPPRRRTLLRTLFADSPRSYAEVVASDAGIPPGGIGPTRARALRQLRDKLNELGPEADPGEYVEEQPKEGDRTGSHLLDDLLDKADQALREKLEPKVTNLRIGHSQGTGDAELDSLLHRADAALRERVLPVATRNKTND
jgi:RNA polymerase sigma factor (sigma-70 family)